MNFCKVCMNLLEIKNKVFICNNCNNTSEVYNNSVLFHINNSKNYFEEHNNSNNIKKHDIFRRKKDNTNNEFVLYTDKNFNASKINVKSNKF